MSVLVGLGVLAAVFAVMFAHLRAYQTVVVTIRVRRGNGGNWRWFAYDARENLLGSCFPHSYSTGPMAADFARFIFPYAKVQVEP